MVEDPDTDNNYGLLDSADLLSGGDLLPDGTRIFASNYNYSRTFWKLSFATLLAEICCFIGVISCHVSTTPGTIFLVLFFLFLLLGLSLMYWTHTTDLRNYCNLSTAGAWHEGIVVFQNGTVVYRTKSLFEDTEITFEGSEIEEVQLTHTYSMGKQCRTCGGKGEPDCCFLHFAIAPLRGMGGSQATGSRLRNHYIDCSEIKESGQTVVDYIKDIQLRSSPSLVSY